MPEPNSGCWLWTGFLDPFGIGRIFGESARRVAWKFYKAEPIPIGAQITVKCGIASCVNPDHFALKRTQTPAERFLGGFVQGADDECWPWAKTKQARGYGHITIDGATVLTHRFSYAHFKGPIPPGLSVLHKCDNPPCVNPNHLFLGTPLDNERDKISKGRQRYLMGAAHHQSKLTDADIIAIRQSDEPGRTLAGRFGVHQVNISLIKRRRAWKHVP